MSNPVDISKKYSFHDPVEEGYFNEVQVIKKKTNDILQKIADFEKRHQTYHREVDDLDNQECEDMYNELDGRKKFTITPRSFESYKEEELDLRAKLRKLNRKNTRLRGNIEDVKRLIVDSLIVEKELKSQLDLSYRKRILLERKGVAVISK